MITAKKLTIQYIKEYATIFDVDFCIDSNTLFLSNPDEISALFRTLTKIDKKYFGQIEIDALDIKEIQDKDLSIAYVTKDPYLFRFKSLKQNLIYPLKIRKFSKFDINNKLNSINKFLSKLPKCIKKMTLSQRKIITLLRAYMWNPKYMILEHFFENLDQRDQPIANIIINEISKTTLIIASENEENNIYENFKKITLDHGSIKNGTK